MRARLPLLLIIAVAVAVRLIGLGDTALLGSEVFAFQVASLPLPDLFFPRLVDNGTQIGFYVIAHLWIIGISLVAPPDPVSLRVLPLLFSVATIPVTAAIAHRIATRLALSPTLVRALPLVAAAILALSPLAVQYAREFRAYSLELLLLTLASWIALRAIDSPVKVRHWWIAYGALTAFVLYVHMLAGLFVATQMGGLLLVALSTRRSELAADLFKSAALTLVLIVPLVDTLLRFGPSPMNWILPLDLERVLATLARLVGAAGEAVSPSAGNGPAAPEQHLLIFVVAALPVLLGAGYLLRHWRRKPDAVVLVVAPLVAVPLALAALSVLVAPVWVTRYLYVLLMPISIVGGIGVLALIAAARAVLGSTRPWAALLACSLAVAATLVPLATLLLDTLRDAS